MPLLEGLALERANKLFSLERAQMEARLGVGKVSPAAFERYRRAWCRRWGEKNWESDRYAAASAIGRRFARAER